MKKLIIIFFFGIGLFACKKVDKQKTFIDDKKIADSIQRAKEEQEVLNLKIDDSKTFDNTIKDGKK